MIMSAPRVYAKMAGDGLLPGALQFRGSAPRVAIAAQALLASIFILVSSLRQLLSYLGLTLSLCAACTAACLFLPSVRSGASPRWFHRTRLPATLYVVATLSTAAIMTFNDPLQLVGTALTFSLGAIVYLIVRRA
jgi:APA family basic amino acid/polyamine antiporter